MILKQKKGNQLGQRGASPAQSQQIGRQTAQLQAPILASQADLQQYAAQQQQQQQ